METFVINHVVEITYEDNVIIEKNITGIKLAEMYNKAFCEGRNRIFQVVVDGPKTSSLSLFNSQPYYLLEIDPWDSFTQTEMKKMPKQEFIDFFQKYILINKLSDAPELEEQNRCVIL